MKTIFFKAKPNEIPNELKHKQKYISINFPFVHFAGTEGLKKMLMQHL